MSVVVLSARSPPARRSWRRARMRSWSYTIGKRRSNAARSPRRQEIRSPVISPGLSESLRVKGSPCGLHGRTPLRRPILGPARRSNQVRTARHRGGRAGGRQSGPCPEANGVSGGKWGGGPMTGPGGGGGGFKKKVFFKEGRGRRGKKRGGGPPFPGGPGGG